MTNRFWCFTLNNPHAQIDVDYIEPWIGNGLRYCIYQLEVGESGTPHYQGYLELDRGQRLSYVTSHLEGAHFEPRRGTQQQAMDYCRKEESRVDGPWEFGTPTAGQGARQDIQAFKKDIDEGATDLQLWDSHPLQFLRYGRMVDRIRLLKQPKRTWKTEVWYLYGPPGVGKSRMAGELAGPDAYWKSPNEVWWDGYNGQESVVLDDFSAKWLPWSTLLQVLDTNPLTLPVKGAHVNFVAKKLVITSNAKPKDLYGRRDDEEDTARKYPLEALTRRVDHWVIFFPGIGFTLDNPDYDLIETVSFSNYAAAADYLA